MKQVVGACSVSLVLAAAAASAQTPASAEFRVNTYTTERQYDARPAMEPDGDFVVVWTSLGQDGSGYGAFGQRFAASGVPRGGEFRVNSSTTGPQWAPNVAVGSRGDFVVVWHSSHLLPTGIVGQRYDASGNPLGIEFLVSSSTTYLGLFPRIGRASDGSFVVNWTREPVDPDNRNPDVVARRFDAWGNPIGGEFVVNTYTTGRQDWSEIAVEANGNFVVVWPDGNGRDGSGGAVFGQRFDASGNRLGTEFQVNTYTTGAQFRTSVSVSPAGGFVVTWTSSYGDGSTSAVFARRFDPSGNPAGNEFVVNTYTTGSQAGFLTQVAHDGLGNFVVVWEDCCERDGSGAAVFGQRFDASGMRRGAEFQVNTYTTASQREASVASDAVGNFTVFWRSFGQDGSLSGIYAQRFGGLGPAALAVDGAGGNQVLEPGETVDLGPSWRNVNGTTQTFRGALTAITGPPGAAYTITDPTGDYGTVADGATAPCADCYVVRVSNPNPRPALHWDASAVESILPDMQGQQKQWVLHVGRSFEDVGTASPFYPFIETLLHHRISGGCGGANYCPSTGTTRDQMSVFVLVAKEGAGYAPPGCGTPRFVDVPAANPFCRFIEELARRGVVSGCGGGNFCPISPVTREQMAVFVLRTLDPSLDPPACTTPVFNDVPSSSPFCRWIEELARRGVVTGCAGGGYCPQQPVTREQMSVFISGTFGLTLYGP
jgi:S-layer homology domain